MKKALLSGVLCTSLLLLSIGESFAQGGIFSKRNKALQYSTVGIGGGTSHYFGDLSPYRTFYYGVITNVRWNATLNYTRQLTPKIAARFAFNYARIAGDDYTYAKANMERYNMLYLRNLHFRNDIKEFSISGIFNLLPAAGKGQKGRNKVMPYAVLGVGFYAHNPKARDTATVNADGKVVLGKWVALKDLQTSGQGLDDNYPKAYSLLQVVFPVGLGIKFKVTERMDINLEGGFRITPFDYLDDVGATGYPDPNALATVTPAGVRFSNRAAENIAAGTGKSRVQDFADIVTKYYGAPAGQTPKDNGHGYVGYSAHTPRGVPKWDSYLLVQVTLNYILGDGIKCPPIK